MQLLNQFRILVWRCHDRIAGQDGSIVDAQALVIQLQQFDDRGELLALNLLRGYANMALRIWEREIDLRRQVGDEHGEGAKPEFYEKLRVAATDITYLLKVFNQVRKLVGLSGQVYARTFETALEKVSGDVEFMEVLKDAGMLKEVKKLYK